MSDPAHAKKKKLSEEVVERIQDLIIRDAMKSGDRLPTEQELADQFGVSRISVREATKALNFLGIIESAPRRGLTIGSVNMKRLANVLGFQFALDNYPREMLLKTRLAIELGALQFTMQSLQEDGKLYDQLIDKCQELENTSDPDQYIQRDADIHCALVKASGIEPLVAFNEMIQIFFTRFRDVTLAVRDHVPQSIRAHRTLLELLREGKLPAAENLLRQHLDVYKKET